MGEDAGNYVVYYKIAKNGYVTVSGSETVTIDKLNVVLTWTVDEAFENGSVEGQPASDYKTSFVDNKTFNAPTASFSDTNNNTVTLTMTESVNGKVELTACTVAATELNKVGHYTYTATVGDNYNIINGTETLKLLIDGGKINGYKLKNADANGDNTIDDKDETVWYDGAEHAAAQLVVPDPKPEGNPDDASVTKTYYLSKDGGTEVEYGEIPNVTEVGEYTLRVVLNAGSNYYEYKSEPVSFEIKSVEYVTEKTDYIYGWDLILVYTNDAVPGFTYNGHYMYDMSQFGTKKYFYGTEFDAQGAPIAGKEGTPYTHVFGLLVNGVADENLVVPSNDKTNTHTLYLVTNGGIVDGTLYPTPYNRNDVNESNAPDLRDMVAVQAVYNVDATYLTDAQMHIALKCDVNGSKVCNMADYNQVKNAYKGI